MNTYRLVISGGAALPQFTHEFTAEHDRQAETRAINVIGLITGSPFFNCDLHREHKWIASYYRTTQVELRKKADEFGIYDKERGK